MKKPSFSCIENNTVFNAPIKDQRLVAKRMHSWRELIAVGRNRYFSMKGVRKDRLINIGLDK